MLKLKKLQILGFKSFCDRAELKFHGEGIAAIVGPNGCGKSNIADAISWVLGEQSAKTLRGSRMEDVIFAGTRDRQATGLAEVSLTLIDPGVYEGGDVGGPEIEVVDEIPGEDWDEAAVRAQAAADTEAHIEEVQPLPAEEISQEAGGGTQETGALPEGVASSEQGSGAEEPAKEGGHPAVVLKIRRRKFKRQEFKAGQLVITRRLFRTGDSEYLLNGKLCRLRDIQEMFMGTGLGPESYALIEQGRIGQILSSKPHDRRAIIEEAAGITKFKTKKRLAELRLEEAKQNLARLNDIFEEVTRQMNSLKRQASKAERYAKLRDEMKTKLKVVLASKLAQLAREAAMIEAELAALAQEMDVRAEAAGQMELAQSQARERGYAIESELRQNSERSSAITLEIDRSLAQRRHNEERCRELALRSEVGEADLARAEAQMSDLDAELEANRRVLATAAANAADGQAEAVARQQEAAEAAAVLAEMEQQQEQRRVEIMEVAAAAAEVRNLITQAEEHRAALDREATRLEQEIAVAIAAMESSGGRRGQLTLEFESVSQRVAWLGLQIESTRQELETTRAEETECKRRMDTLRAEFATALGKKASLESVIAEHGYSTESVKRLFQSGVRHGGQNGFAPAGVLADFLEVEGQYEHVVEDFLRDELNYVVVKSWDAADEGLRLLRGDVEGRATFLVHPEDSQAKFSFSVDESLRFSPRADHVVPLKNCIRVLNGFGKSLEVILSKLGNGYITPDPALARELALENPDAFFLSQSGECFHNVTVTGGRQRAEGPLSLKRELREITRQLEVMEKTLGAEEHRAAKLALRLKELEHQLSELEQQRLEAEKQALTSSHVLEQLASELERNRERRETYSLEWERVKSASAEKHVLLVAKQAEAGTHELRRAELESQRTAAQEELAALKTARDTAAQTAAEVGARLAALEAQRTAAAAALERIETLASDARMRIDGLRSRLGAAAAERREREQENLQLAERLQGLDVERAEAQARRVELQAESDELRIRLAEIEQQLRETRQALDQARDRRGELSAAAAKLTSDIQYMEQTAINELGIAGEALRNDPAALRVEGEQLAAEEAMYREMRTRLDNMGPVNMMALEEYQETAQRHTFLETQRKDLLDSIENTQNTIREIDVFSRQKFQEAFGKINENFQTTFRKLFGGGNAFMRLTDEENTAESGIDVVASPPGKKLQNVLLLSGGEKALTALALLVGIFQYQPSPFCILDEVDAPLDEANIGRFTDLVKEMSLKTQFVLITHSKKTMSIAPVLYGVTMQEPGVSKLVSVRFGAA